MAKQRILTIIAVISAITFMLSGNAAAADGTLRVTFKYKNDGAEEALSSAYLYLQNGNQSPPMEKYFKNADYIFGPSDSSGRISASVPEGMYYMRLTKRSPLASPEPLGPPEAGDYTWTDYRLVNITAGTVTDLGTKYAFLFREDHIQITGTLTNSNGEPLTNRYVKAQIEPCIEADGYYGIASNSCGPVKFPAQQRTDAEGKYTLLLNEPGTYYIVVSTTLGDKHQRYQGNSSSTGWYMGPITVEGGDKIVLNNR